MVVERVRFDSSARPCCSILAATQEWLHTHLMGFERQTQFPDAEMIAELLGGQ
jgi:hypothetical protein